MKNYNYHPVTHEFINATDARLDPLESKIQGQSVYLLPSNATRGAPPEVGEKEIAVFVNGKWEIKPDHRGTTYYDTQTGEPIIIDTIGEINETLADTPPSSAFDEWDGEKWVKSLSKMKDAKKTEIQNDRADAERLFNLLKPLIDGGNAADLESSLIAQADAAKNEEELEAVKWGNL